jgi:hypothetical protein
MQVIPSQRSLHRFRADAWPIYRDRVLLRTLPVIALAVGAGYGIAMHSTGTRVLSWFLVLPAVMVAVLLVSSRRRLRMSFDSFELEVAADEVIRRQAQTRDLVLRRDEVKAINETPGGMILLGPTRFDTIGIPVEIERYSEVAERVRSWAPTSQPRRRRGGLVGAGAGIATILLLAVAFMAPKPVVGAGAAALLAVFLIWAFTEMRKNPNLDRKTRRAAWYIALPAAALVVRLLRFFILGE